MKYRDLIKLLEPIADEEINMNCSSEQEYQSLYDDDPELGNRKKTTDTVRFYHSLDDNNDFVVGVRQVYDSESFDNIGETKVITEL